MRMRSRFRAMLLSDRVWLFGSFLCKTRIDRDTRPLFVIESSVPFIVAVQLFCLDVPAPAVAAQA